MPPSDLERSSTGSFSAQKRHQCLVIRAQNERAPPQVHPQCSPIEYFFSWSVSRLEAKAMVTKSVPLRLLKYGS